LSLLFLPFLDLFASLFARVSQIEPRLKWPRQLSQRANAVAVPALVQKNAVFASFHNRFSLSKSVADFFGTLGMSPKPAI
jgi:hypothetical protein